MWQLLLGSYLIAFTSLGPALPVMWCNTRDTWATRWEEVIRCDRFCAKLTRTGLEDGISNTCVNHTNLPWYNSHCKWRLWTGRRVGPSHLNSRTQRNSQPNQAENQTEHWARSKQTCVLSLFDWWLVEGNTLTYLTPDRAVQKRSNQSVYKNVLTSPCPKHLVWSSVSVMTVRI